MSEATVLLTGATGFLGKVVLERLVRRHAELGVGRVIALVRARDAAQARERLEREVLAARCFEGMPADALRRVEAIAGDVTEPSCGVAREIASGFSSAPLHVIHCAASIEFDLPAAEAARINVRGALHVADLARSIASLRSLVSVSTAYVTPARDGAIEEKIAPLPRPADEILEAIERGTVEDAALLAETGHPNSYTLTKCIAEHLLVARASDLPLTLVRPSIIAASWREPFAGWIDSHAAFAGFVALVGTGNLRVVVGDPDVRLDLVPVDVVAERILDAAFEPRGEGQTPRIRHAVSGLAASPTISDCRRAIEARFGRHPVGAGPRLERLAVEGRPSRMAEWRWHRLPAAAAGAWYTLTRNGRMRRMLRKLTARQRSLNGVFPYFTHHEFDFRGAAPDAGFDPRAYLERVCDGVREHLLRQPPTEMSFAGREHRGGSVARAALLRRRAIPAHRPAAVVLDRIFRRSLSRATVDSESFEAALAERRSDEHVVFVASHRSYFDFLLIPYLAFVRPDLGLPAPQIAADESFGRIPGLGRIASACGAFFLQRGVGREVKGLTGQIHRLVKRRETLLFFIEGRRSRSRAMLSPKRGLLRALQSTGERFLLLPVAISYDRVVEEASFATELEGGERAPMRLRELGTWLARLRRGEVDAGRAHVACGRGVRLDLRTEVEAVADTTVRELESALVATTFHLGAFLRHHPVAGCDDAWLAATLRNRGLRVLESPLSPETPLAPAIAASFRHQFAHALRGPDDRQSDDPRLAAMLELLASLDEGEAAEGPSGSAGMVSLPDVPSLR